ALMDSVSTGYDSNAVIKFNTGYFFKLGENSLIVIDEPGAELANLIVLSLDQGIIQGKNTEKEDAVVQIKTGEATTELKGRASFGIRVNKDKSAEVWVQKGSARITKKSGEVLEIEENEHKQFATLGEGLHDTKYIFKDYGTKVKTPAGEYQFAQSGSQRDELADGLSRSVINKYITKNRKKIDICYHKRGNEFRGGKIVVRLVIEKTGGVISASVTSSTLNNTTIENCVLFWIKAIKFPPFKGEAVAETITYVFE
ncbi:MAG: AgmX/PglI C-terminal domain-containing protein, partial [Oligoflexia bacterium]|nr:AgmX/PglI C-terminal domain-containing protein [Oligoflexia bacterium]